MGTVTRINSSSGAPEFETIGSGLDVVSKEGHQKLENQNLQSEPNEVALESMTWRFLGGSRIESGSQKVETTNVQTAPQTTAQPPTTTTSAAPPAAPPQPSAAPRKGFLGRVWDGIKDAGRAVGNAVATVANHVGDALHTVGSGIVSGVVGAVRNVGEGLGNIFSGVGKMLDIRPLGKIFRGDFAGAFRDYGRNFLDGITDVGKGVLKATLQTAADALIIGVVSGVSAIQSLIGAEPLGRKLNEDEIAELRKVYGDTIDYSQVRVKEGKAGLLSLLSQGGDRPFTLGNTIYMKEDRTMATLVHEMAHVWQHQTGGTDYITEALGAQFFGDGYDFEKALTEGKAWSEMNPEQQAALIEEAYKNGFFDNPNATYLIDGVDYAPQMRDAINQMRNGQGAP